MFKSDVKRCKEFICVGLNLIEGIVAFISPKHPKKLVTTKILNLIIYRFVCCVNDCMHRVAVDIQQYLRQGIKLETVNNDDCNELC